MQKYGPYAFRSLVKLDHKGAICVMDAHCALCARGARWIAHNDREFHFRIVPLQSETGRQLLSFYQIDPDDPASWLLLDKGLPLTATDAIMRTGALLGGVWRGLWIFRLVPRRLRDWAYHLVARNRIRWFGRADLCAMPDPEVAKRLIT